MNYPTFKNKAYQNLFMNFVLFSEGMDEYNSDRVLKTICNMNELMFFLQKGQDENNFDTFRQTCAKLRPHLRGLNNLAFDRLLVEISDESTRGMNGELVQRFYFLWERIMRELKFED